MKQRIFAVALALCLCLSSQSVVYAWQKDILLQEDVHTKESASELVTRDSTIPTQAEAYEAMIALKDDDRYKEGTIWTNDEPYSDKKGYYHWKGGPLDGKNIVAAGCVAFAFILSDAAFGSFPARMYAEGKFTFADIKVGDILRVNTDTHTVIVLEVSDAGVVIAEGNNSGKIHWGRAISKENVMRDTSHYITRYPEGYIPPDDPDAKGKTFTVSKITYKVTKAGKEVELTVSKSAAKKINVGIVTGKDGVQYKVTSIRSNAMQNNKKMTSLVIGDHVKKIGANACSGCTNLTTVAIGTMSKSNLTTIGKSAFNGCKKL